MGKIIFDIGFVSVLIETPEKYAAGIIENTCFPAVNSKQVHYDLHLIVHSEKKSENYVADYQAGKNFQYSVDSFRFLNSYFDAVVEHLFTKDKYCVVHVYPKKPNRLAKKYIIYLILELTRSFKRNHVNINDRVSNSIMSYSLFWFLISCILQKKEMAFIHAATIEKNGKAMLLAGTGGCGKTSTAFKILEDTNCSYLSEDFSIVSKDGNAFFNPKAVSLYASDLRGSPKIFKKYIMNNVMSAERNKWFNYQPNINLNPMIKVPPCELLSKNQLILKAKLGVAFFLLRGGFKVIDHKKINKIEFSERTTDATLRELKTLNEIITLGRSVVYEHGNIPTLAKFRSALTQSHYKAVKNISCYLVKIPESANPSDVANYIKMVAKW